MNGGKLQVPPPLPTGFSEAVFGAGFRKQHRSPVFFFQRINDVLWGVALHFHSPGAEKPVIEQRIPHPQVQEVPARRLQFDADRVGVAAVGRGHLLQRLHHRQ